MHECHSWVGSERGMLELPAGYETVPNTLHWDLWVGPAAMRPYSKSYVPYIYKFWWDFGTGETGNWGCHILDIPFWALGLRGTEQGRGVGAAGGPAAEPEEHGRAVRVSRRMRAWSDHLTLVSRHATHCP